MTTLRHDLKAKETSNLRYEIKITKEGNYKVIVWGFKGKEQKAAEGIYGSYRSAQTFGRAWVVNRYKLSGIDKS
jgi:hypothetical protein